MADRRVGNRALVYLDQNVWIELRDSDGRAQAACFAMCREAIREQRALFPLAFPAVIEAMLIEDDTKRLKHADLLDEFSDGITYRARPSLFAEEARLALEWFINGKWTQLSRSRVLTSLPDYSGTGMIEFPVGWTKRDAEKLVSLVADDPKFRTLRFFAERCDWVSGLQSSRDDYVREMGERLRALGKQKSPDKTAAVARAVLRERSFLFNEHVRPVMPQLALEQSNPRAFLDELLTNKGEGGTRRLDQLFQRMPMMNQLAHLHAFASLEPARRPRAQDFYDIEHGVVPAIYSDAFVTLDKRLAQLVQRTGCASARVLTTIEQLTAWLSDRR